MAQANCASSSGTPLYKTIAEHFETWLELARAGQFDGHGDHHTPRAFVRQAFRKYPECGIFARGFARAPCDDCGHDYFVAYSCKGRGVYGVWQRDVESGGEVRHLIAKRLKDLTPMLGQLTTQSRAFH